MKKLVLSILSFFLFVSCTKDDSIISQIIEKNKYLQVKDQVKPKNPILIGDSNVKTIKSTKGFNETDVKVGKYKSGISTIGLINLLKSEKVDSNITTIFIAIGTNDGYMGDPSLKLRLQLNKIYPNAKNLYVIWGSRGWSGVKFKTVEQQEAYYKKFQYSGFKIIKVTSGNFSTDKLAHTANQKYQLEIIEKIKNLNQL